MLLHHVPDLEAIGFPHQLDEQQAKLKIAVGTALGLALAGHAQVIAEIAGVLVICGDEQQGCSAGVHGSHAHANGAFRVFFRIGCPESIQGFLLFLDILSHEMALNLLQPHKEAGVGGKGYIRKMLRLPDPEVVNCPLRIAVAPGQHKAADQILNHFLIIGMGDHFLVRELSLIFFEFLHGIAASSQIP